MDLLPTPWRGFMMAGFAAAYDRVDIAETPGIMPAHGAGVERTIRVLAARSGHRSRDLPLDTSEDP